MILNPSRLHRSITCRHKEKRRGARRSKRTKSQDPPIYSISIWIEIHPNRGSVCYSVSISPINLQRVLKIPNSTREARKASQLWAVTRV